MNMHAIIVKKQNRVSSKEKARQIAHKYHNHIPGFVRETSMSFVYERYQKQNSIEKHFVLK